MKKLLILFLLILSLASFGQVTYKATTLKIGVRENSLQDLEWKSFDTGLEIPVHISDDNVITIYSKIFQKYYPITEVAASDGVSTIWTCIDKDGKRCNVYLIVVLGSNYLHVEYDDMGWYYKLEEY